MGALIFIVVVLLAMTSIGWILRKKELKRSEGLAQIAESLGMSYSRKVDKTFRKELIEFERFSRKNRRNRNHIFFRNKINGKVNNVELVFFECTPDTDSRGVGSQHGVFYFKSTDVNFPCFVLRPVILMKQMFLETMGVQQINIENHPAFSQKYMLQGQDESAVLKLFSARVLDLLGSLNDRFYIEANGNRMILYRSIDNDDPSGRQVDMRISLQDFEAVKLQATEIYQSFL